MKLICVSGAEPLPSFLNTCSSLIRSAWDHWIVGVREEERLGSRTLPLVHHGRAFCLAQGVGEAVRKGNQKRQWVMQSILGEGNRRRELMGTCSVLEQRLRQIPVEKLSWDEAGET